MVTSSIRASLLVVFSLSVGMGNAFAQGALVRGRVVDADSGDPLPGVNIFLSQTMIGGVTNDQGWFEIKRVPPGAYEMVASMVGFSRGTERLEVTPERDNYVLQLRIAPIVVEMHEVEVIGEYPRAWRRNLRRFERLFIGTGPNAGATEIVNPFVLSFDERDGTFFASASEPLTVVNRALGYEITFVLTDFRLDQTAELLYMNGPFHFRELEAEDAEMDERWLANRARTYRGSLQHILQSLIQHTTFVQGIFVRLDDRKNAPYSEKPYRENEAFLTPIAGLGLITATDRPYLYTLDFPDYLYINYRDEPSWIELNWGAATIHESGYVYAPAGAPGSLTVHGSLAKRRVADLLPREYLWSGQDPSQ